MCGLKLIRPVLKYPCGHHTDIKPVLKYPFKTVPAEVMLCVWRYSRSWCACVCGGSPGHVFSLSPGVSAEVLPGHAVLCRRFSAERGRRSLQACGRSALLLLPERRVRLQHPRHRLTVAVGTKNNYKGPGSGGICGSVPPTQ